MERRLHPANALQIASSTQGACILLFTIDESPICARFRSSLYEATRPRGLALLEVDAAAQPEVIEELGVRHVPSGVLYVGGQVAGHIVTQAQPVAMRASIAALLLAHPF